jgi:acyl carrier protein
VAGVLRVREEEVREERPLSGPGLDSLAAVELQHELETALGASPSARRAAGRDDLR